MHDVTKQNTTGIRSYAKSVNGKWKMRKKMITYGIDNGKNGGIVAVDGAGELIHKWVMPLTDEGQLDTDAIVEPFSVFTKDDNLHVYLEQAQPMPKQGVSSTFKTGYWYGLIEGMFNALWIPYTIINPRRWQNHFFKGMKEKDTKKKSFECASRLWPEQNWIVPKHGVKKTTKFHDGLTDAALIAEYGRLDRLSKKL